MSRQPTQIAIEAAKLKVAIARQRGESVEPWVAELAGAVVADDEDAPTPADGEAEGITPLQRSNPDPPVVDLRDAPRTVALPETEAFTQQGSRGSRRNEP